MAYLSPGEVVSPWNKSVLPNGFEEQPKVPPLLQIYHCVLVRLPRPPRRSPPCKRNLFWSFAQQGPRRAPRPAPFKPPWLGHAVSRPPPRGHPPVQAAPAEEAWLGGEGRRARLLPVATPSVRSPPPRPLPASPLTPLPEPAPPPREERRVPPVQPFRSWRESAEERVSPAVGGFPAGSAPGSRAPRFPPQPAWTARREGWGPWSPREVSLRNWIKA